MIKLAFAFLIFNILLSVFYSQIFLMAQSTQDIKPPSGWENISDKSLPELPDQTIWM